ncbi:ComF family protein [Bowmanella denitrificans]|uniref:ComF family protein n=1 Tax=Bowmanella denitrificans TaxID=366582 RepID=UPI0031D6A0FB
MPISIRSLLQGMHRQACLLCLQDSHTLLCQHCQADLPILNLAQYQHNLLNRPDIAQGLENINYQRLVACAPYQWPWDRLITSLKFSQRLLCAKALAEQFYRLTLFARQDLPEAILPMPLHASRYMRRRYNQAGEIAGQLSRLSHIPVDHHLCRRSKATLPQTELTGAQRRHNLRDAFCLNGPLPYRHIAVLDDVITTGTTISSLCHTLRCARVDLHIEVWCIAISLKSPLE